MSEIETNFSENIIWIGAAGFEAHRDRLIILQDEFRSGFECSRCLDKNKHTVHGREVSTITCEGCKGEGRRPKAGNADLRIKCSECEGEGWIVCPECKGKGGDIVLSDKQKDNRPTTGTIVSMGEDVVQEGKWKRGDRCIYPSSAGFAYDLVGRTRNGKVAECVLVVLRDQEILSKMHGILEQNQVKRSAALHTVA